MRIDLHGEDYRDRVYGCWQGKNAGGTLGTPLEKAWGEEEPLDVWWYPELKEGGLPNDDLEMQLVWLKALEEVGPGIKARDLARYWLDHIGYNFDEYGLSKLNLRWGLEPPVSGHHNNWFTDCMGSPIRSEIWACVAPGHPRIAARYAYEDAICDHAGGEGVYGELFNVAFESAAFVVQDTTTLIDIALSYVPRDSQIHKAVSTAVQAHADGLDWKQARRAVLDATPHYNAQYSPINTAFQVIGLLYGTGFGETICITVNCGYDTDSSGAAIGSYMGILLGSKELPAEWVAPLGTAIATNQYWGGVKNLDAGDNPVPSDLDELLERIGRAAVRVLTHHGVLHGSQSEVNLEDLYADDGIRELAEKSPNVVEFSSPDFGLLVDYGDGPVAVPGVSRTVGTTHVSTRLEPLEIDVALAMPDGWQVEPEQHRLSLQPEGSGTCEWRVTPPPIGQVSTSNIGYLRTAIAGRPASPAQPVVLLGAFALRVSPAYPLAESIAASLDAVHPPEQADPAIEWAEDFSSGYEQPVSRLFSEGGAVRYLQTFVESPSEREVFIIVDPSCPVRYWVGGDEVGRNEEFRRIRPNQGTTVPVGNTITLRQGWNEILVKLVHDGAAPPAELHLGFSDRPRISNHVWDLHRSAFPWSALDDGSDHDHPPSDGSNGNESKE